MGSDLCIQHFWSLSPKPFGKPSGFVSVLFQEHALSGMQDKAATR